MKFSKFNLIVNNKLGQHFIFNTLNGNCLEVKKNIVELVSGNKVKSLDCSLLNEFTRLGLIVDDFIDENRIFKYFHNREKFRSDAVMSTVLLSWACNLKCVYCFEGNNEGINMNLEQADQYIKFMENLAIEKSAKRMAICLFGGEPLVNFKIGVYILKTLKSFCEENSMIFTCSIITNGILLNEDVIERLIKFNCNMVQITLDGIQEIHDSRRMFKDGSGSFDKIIESLGLLNSKKNLLHTVIRVNIDKINLEETYKLLNFIGKDGIDLTNCTVDFGIVRGSTEACSAYSENCFVEGEIGDVLFELWNVAEKEGFKYNIRPIRRWLYCGLYSDNQFTVTPDCEVYKCWEHTGNKEHLMGVIDENGRINNMQYNFFDWMSNDPLNNKECSQCAYLPTCGGGCGVVSYNESKTYHSTGCFKVKGVVEKQILKYVEQVANSKNLNLQIRGEN